MRLPDVTHLQFAILDVLCAKRKSGQEVRTRLKSLGIRKTGPAFYQLMARFEDGGLVKGSYEQQTVDGQVIKQRPLGTPQDRTAREQ